MAVERLPVARASELGAAPPELRWLVDALWSEGAIGLIGGEPKACKSFLALDLAVAVASGAPCLRLFEVPVTGSVLLFAAEDALEVVRARLHGIAKAAHVSFEDLDVQVITADVVRLDLERDRKRLWATVQEVQPKLLILDPFVRLHRCDENLASEVVSMLAYLRELQRHFGTAVLLVHHARKTAHARAGQALRGSSGIFAWGDSYIFVRRSKEKPILSVEHRAAPTIDDLHIELHADGAALALRAVNATADKDRSLHERITDLLTAESRPLSQRKIREACRGRATTIASTLGELVAEGVLDHDSEGYRLAT